MHANTVITSIKKHNIISALKLILNHAVIFTLYSVPTMSIPTLSTSHFVNSQFVNDEMGIDKLGIDQRHVLIAHIEVEEYMI